MADYIDRDALFSYLIRQTGFRTNCDGCPDIDCLDCIANEAIKMVPTIDVAPVRHGRWILIETDEEQFFFCSECENKEYWESDFCPSCGAKMDGGIY